MMETTIAEIVFILLNSDKLKDKLLGMQIGSLFDKKNKKEIKIEKVKDKLYHKYLDMLDIEVAKQLINIDFAIRGITNYLYGTTYWYIDELGNFHFNSEILTRTEEGYEVDTEQKLRFYNNHSDELNMVHNFLTEKESIIASNPPLKDSENEKLANLIREVVFKTTEELKNVPRIYQKK